VQRADVYRLQHLSHSGIVDPISSISLLELPGQVSGDPVRVRVLEPGHDDPVGLYEQILTGRYARPFIIDDGETRQLLFSLDFIQSAMRVDDPFALEFAYTRKMMAFVLFVPKPRHVLMVGLGGGSLAKFCHRHLPRTRLTVVEVDPDVIALRGEFKVPDDERLAIVQADAAEYLPSAEGDTDVLLLDGFDSRGIAPAFLNRGFYRTARRRLRAGGIAVANYDSVATMQGGLNIFQTAIILFFVSTAVKKGAGIPIVDKQAALAGAVDVGTVINPLPHVLMLTAIVVGVSVTGVALAMLVRIYRQYGTLEEDEILEKLQR
jgi:spermidine synthase